MNIGSEDLTINQKAVFLAVSALETRGKLKHREIQDFLYSLSKSMPEALEDILKQFDITNNGVYNEYADEIVDTLKLYGLIDSGKHLTASGKETESRLKDDKECIAILDKIKALEVE